MPGRASLSLYSILFNTRESRGGWPLLTVETEVKGDSKRINERSPFLDGLLHAGTRDFCSALAVLVGTEHYINTFDPVAQQAGQAAMLGRLSLCMCPFLKLSSVGNIRNNLENFVS